MQQLPVVAPEGPQDQVAEALDVAAAHPLHLLVDVHNVVIGRRSILPQEDFGQPKAAGQHPVILLQLLSLQVGELRRWEIGAYFLPALLLQGGDIGEGDEVQLLVFVFPVEENPHPHPQHLAVHPQVVDVPRRPGRAALVGLLKDAQQHRLVIVPDVAPQLLAQFLVVRYIQPGQLVILLVDPDNINLAVVDVINGEGPQDVVHHGVGEEVSIHQLPDVEGLHLLAVQAAVVQPPLVRQGGLQLLDGKGLVIVVALGVPAAQMPQDVLLLKGLHTLHNNRQTHQPGQQHLSPQ